jgi:hypothetical protein
MLIVSLSAAEIATASGLAFSGQAPLPVAPITQTPRQTTRAHCDKSRKHRMKFRILF